MAKSEKIAFGLQVKIEVDERRGIYGQIGGYFVFI